jgi:hypothetical protein
VRRQVENRQTFKRKTRHACGSLLLPQDGVPHRLFPSVGEGRDADKRRDMTDHGSPSVEAGRENRFASACGRRPSGEGQDGVT